MAYIKGIVLDRFANLCYDKHKRFYIRAFDTQKRGDDMPNADKHRVTTTLTGEEFDQLEHWARRKEMSINDFIRDSILFKIRWELKDYPLAPLEVQRLNQLQDLVTVLSQNVKSLEDVVVSGFDSLLGLTRGDNYLLHDEDGEL